MTTSTQSATQFHYQTAFGRNLGWVTEDEQQTLRKKRVAIGGLGGSGGIHLVTLARLGIGAFNLADFDTFDLVNFNRQSGAMMSTVGKPKIDVMSKVALDINPELDLKLFRDGVLALNVREFFEGVDLYIDALDFFAFDTRALVFKTLAELKIPAISVAPLGMGAALINFLPGQMTFEEYFRWEGQSDVEKALRFMLGLSPAMLQRTYLADPSRVRFGNRAGPSTGAACQLCAWGRRDRSGEDIAEAGASAGRSAPPFNSMPTATNSRAPGGLLAMRTGFKRVVMWVIRRRLARAQNLTLPGRDEVKS